MSRFVVSAARRPIMLFLRSSICGFVSLRLHHFFFLLNTLLYLRKLKSVCIKILPAWGISPTRSVYFYPAVLRCASARSRSRTPAANTPTPVLARAFAVILFMGFVALNTKAQHPVHLMIESDCV